MKIRHLLGIVILAAAVVPSVTISLMLLDRQYKATQDSMEQELTRVLFSMSQDIRFKFSIFSTNFKLFSSERYLIQALDSFLFVSNAHNSMLQFVEQTPLVSSLYLLDSELHVVDEVLGDIPSYESSQLLSDAKLAVASGLVREKQQYLIEFDNNNLVRPSRIKQQLNTESPFGAAVLMPLYFHSLQEGLTREPAGYILAVLPFDVVYKIVADNLGTDELIEILHDDEIIVASPRIKFVELEHDDLMVERDVLPLASDYTSNQLEYMLQLHVSRSARMLQLQESMNALTLGIAIAICLSVLVAFLVANWLGTPFKQLSEILKRFGQGHYSSKGEKFKFSEFEDVRQLLSEMGKTIRMQLDSLHQKNEELQRIDDLKGEYLTKVRALNEQLEARVAEKTKELSETAAREGRSRQILQSLQRLSIELQQCGEHADVTELCLNQLHELFDDVPVALLIATSRNTERQFQSLGLMAEDEQWLLAELKQRIANQRQSLPETLVNEGKRFYLFDLISRTHNFLGVLAFQLDEVSPQERDIVRVFAKQISVITETIELTSELELAARTDELTDLPNRKAFNESFERSRNILERYPNNHVGIFVIDANGLKRVNDQFGHDAGDQFIKAIVEVLLHSCRKTDQLFRMGGDEFALLVQEGTIASCERLMARLAEQQDQQLALLQQDGSSKQIPISFSVGYASSEEVDVSHLFHRADERMYEAKDTYYKQHPIEPDSLSKTRFS
ncbi:GGDEF domain-containing protein [Neiella marina]|uniref:diguanylate cyclase n=1 Tax=Neiella marina TaxID=508461 RepID=A0A8J2XPG7_9GAMM|nr:diguanylate cyclase [Neiella marina]GGA79905.1 GGDEF domain-containing protein [Neiella marina]